MGQLANALCMALMRGSRLPPLEGDLNDLSGVEAALRREKGIVLAGSRFLIGGERTT